MQPWNERARVVGEIFKKVMPEPDPDTGHTGPATPTTVIPAFVGEIHPMSETVKEETAGALGEAKAVLFPLDIHSELDAVDFEQESHFFKNVDTLEEWELTGVFTFAGRNQYIGLVQH